MPSRMGCVGSGQKGSAQVSFAEVRRREIGAGKVRFPEVGSNQLRRAQLRGGELAAGKVGSREVGASQLRFFQLSFVDVGPAEFCEFRAAEAPPSEIQTTEPAPSRLAPSR